MSPLQRCAIYTRQSRTSDCEFTSCEAQFESGLALIDAHHHDGWLWNGKRYDDEGEGGISIERPALEALLTDICSGEVERVIVYKLDRLARRVRDYLQLLQDFQCRDVAFTIISDPNLSHCAEHTFVLNILASFYEFEYEMTRERLADALGA
jgi:DNA invertase Pin-like site-specific DNA recombinase